MLLLVVMWVKRKLTVLSRQSELGVVMRFITDYSCSIFPADRCFLDCNKNGRITTRAAPYYSRAAATHPAVITHTGDPASLANVQCLYFFGQFYQKCCIWGHRLLKCKKGLSLVRHFILSGESPVILHQDNTHCSLVDSLHWD